MKEVNLLIVVYINIISIILSILLISMGSLLGLLAGCMLFIINFFFIGS